MIVIADTTPINYLILIGEAELLTAVYGEVIPQAVLNELLAERAPESVRRWVRNRPAWLSVEHVDPEALSETVEYLDSGEREAIALARTLQARLLITDDRAGRREALRWDLPVTGTLGVLLAAADRGLVNYASVLSACRRVCLFCDDSSEERRKRATRAYGCGYFTTMLDKSGNGLDAAAA